MGYIGKVPTAVPITSSDLADGIVTTAKLANDSVDNTKLDLTDNYAFTGTVSGTPQSLVRLGGANATGQNVGDISFDLFTTDYDFYYVTFAISFVSASTLLLRLRASSSYLTNSAYKQAAVGIRSDGSGRQLTPHAGGAGTYFQLGSSAESSNSHNSHAGHLLFQKPMVSSKTTQFNFQCTVMDTSVNIIDKTGGGMYLSTGSHNGFGILGTANLDEYNVQVFGVKQS